MGNPMGRARLNAPPNVNCKWRITKSEMALLRQIKVKS